MIFFPIYNTVKIEMNDTNDRLVAVENLSRRLKDHELFQYQLGVVLTRGIRPRPYKFGPPKKGEKIEEKEPINQTEDLTINNK